MVKRELVTTSLKYGLIGGVMIIAPFMMLYLMDLRPLVNLNTLILEGMLMLIFIYFGGREFRDKHNQGILKFWQGMTSGFIIYTCMTLVFLIFFWLFLFYFNPDFLENYKAGAIEYVNDTLQNISDEAEREILSQQKDSILATVKSDLLLDAILKKIVLGLIITPISTVFLRRY